MEFHQGRRSGSPPICLEEANGRETNVEQLGLFRARQIEPPIGNQLYQSLIRIPFLYYIIAGPM
jgi:hypothetical protein